MIVARNTAARHENQIHDDAVAAHYGFRGGLVPGVTVYGYLAGEVASQDRNWLSTGSMRVRFHAPFYDGELLKIKIGDLTFEALDAAGISRSIGETRMTPIAWDEFVDSPLPAIDARPDASAQVLTKGKPLGTIRDRLDLENPQYLEDHCFDALAETSDFYKEIAHPAVLLAMANEILIQNYRLGPWIHASSELTNFGSAQNGDTVTVKGVIADQFAKKGHEFVVLDLAMSNGTRPIMRVRHTAIYRPALVAGLRTGSE